MKKIAKNRKEKDRERKGERKGWAWAENEKERKGRREEKKRENVQQGWTKRHKNVRKRVRARQSDSTHHTPHCGKANERTLHDYRTYKPPLCP